MIGGLSTMNNTTRLDQNDAEGSRIVTQKLRELAEKEKKLKRMEDELNREKMLIQSQKQN